MGFYIFPGRSFLVAVFFKCIALVFFFACLLNFENLWNELAFTTERLSVNWSRKYLLAANDPAYEYFNHRKLGRTPIQLSLKRYLMVLGSLLSPRRFRWPFLKSMWPVERKSFVKSCLVNGNLFSGFLQSIWVGCFSIPQNIQDVHLCLWVNGFAVLGAVFSEKCEAMKDMSFGWLRYVYEK